MALTEANFKANLVTARRMAGQRIGLVGFDGSDAATRNLGYDELRRLNTALVEIILTYPQSCDPVRVSAAQAYKPDGPLEDTSFSVQLFADEVAERAAVAIPQAGIGLLGVAALLVGAWIIIQTMPRVRASRAK